MVLICVIHCGTASKMQGTIKPLFGQAHWILILATSGFCYLVGRCELLLVGYLIRTGSELLLGFVTSRFAPNQSRIRPQHKVVSPQHKVNSFTDTVSICRRVVVSCKHQELRSYHEPHAEIRIRTRFAPNIKWLLTHTHARASCRTPTNATRWILEEAKLNN